MDDELPIPPPPKPIPYTAPDEPPRHRRACPICGSHAMPIRRAKGSTSTLILLLLIGILPGLLYMILFQGYVTACPSCGAKLADIV